MERLHFDVVIGKHAEGRHHLVPEVLELVVAPHDHEIRSELVERLPAMGQPLDEVPTVSGCGVGALVVGPLLAHPLRPAGRVLCLHGDTRVRERAAQQSRHVVVLAGEQREMSQTEADRVGQDNLQVAARGM